MKVNPTNDNESMDSGSTTITTTTEEECYSGTTSQEEGEINNDEIPQTNGDTLVNVSDSTTANISDSTANVAPQTPNLRSSVNDAAVMKLVKHWKVQCSATDEFALNYITQLHHPAISCFREIRKGDLNNLFSNNKWKRHIAEPVEQSVVYMGIIDYIATALNNPLYEENFSKTFAKGGLQTVQKIMMDFKSMIANWSLSEKDVVKKRYEAIMRHLRQLVPLFAAAGQDFETVLDCIDSDIVRIKANQERIKTSFPEDVKDSSKITPSESISDDRFALGEIVLNFGIGANDEKAKTPVSSTSSGASPATMSSKSKSKIRPPTSIKSPNTSTKQQTKSKAMASFRQNQKPSNLACTPTTKRPTPDSNSPLNEAPTKKMKTSQASSPTTEKTDPPTSTEKAKISCVSSKAVESISHPTLVIGEKKINAFAVLMNKSREIAQANKLKKIAAEAKIATRTAV